MKICVQVIQDNQYNNRITIEIPINMRKRLDFNGQYCGNLFTELHLHVENYDPVGTFLWDHAKQIQVNTYPGLMNFTLILLHISTCFKSLLATTIYK